MTTGTWEPGSTSANLALDEALLQRLAGYARPDHLGSLGDVLEADLAGLMALEHQAWAEAASELPSEQLIDLIRVLTLAEKLPGWEAGDKSPVIPLAKCLRQRGQKLDRALLLWIRENSENRFLPYGPL